MSFQNVPILAEAIEKYYDQADLIELCKLFGVEVETDRNELHQKQIAYQRTAINLVTLIDHGNNRKLLQALIPSLLSRCRDGIATTGWQTREFHENMEGRILRLRSLIENDPLPDQISIEENKPFTAKSEAREFIGKAETAVTIVDNYTGIGTLDCLRELDKPVHVLTGSRKQNIENNFSKPLSEFIREGHEIEIRRHPKLHDRYIIFNDRCWMVGSSLKDAGKKTFNIIECVDIKDKIISDVEKKWDEAEVYIDKS